MIAGCNDQRQSNQDRNLAFAEELQKLKDFYHIPGLAVLVKEGEDILFEDYLGYANLAQQTPLDSTHLFPIASISKIFASVLIFQLVEEGKLSLDSSVYSIVEGTDLPDDVLVKHLLSHTSQGEVGHRFLYSNRYGVLSQVIEQASGTKLEQLVQDQIIAPLALTSTAPFSSEQLLEERSQVLLNQFRFGEASLITQSRQEGKLIHGIERSAFKRFFSVMLGIAKKIGDQHG